MAKEIERKFLVRDLAVLDGMPGRYLVQGYLSTPPLAARVHIADDEAFLTIKGEFEVAIPLSDAGELLALCGDPADGYLGTSVVTTRVRIAGVDAFLTIKGPPTGISCDEFEYSIPLADARAMLAMCGDLVVEKTRYEIPVGEYTFEVDVFHGKHVGLVLAEVELPAADALVAIPDWVGAEVSGQRAYTNAHLALSAGASASS